MADPRGVLLTPEFQKDFVLGSDTGFRLRVVASAPVGMEAEVFRYVRRPADPVEGTDRDEFSGVCSVLDYHELPLNEPAEDDCERQFRLAEFDILLPSATEAEEVWDLVRAEVDQLVLALKATDDLEAGTPHQSGDAEA
jgi:hypothetical protein